MIDPPQHQDKTILTCTPNYQWEYVLKSVKDENGCGVSCYKKGSRGGLKYKWVNKHKCDEVFGGLCPVCGE